MYGFRDALGWSIRGLGGSRGDPDCGVDGNGWRKPRRETEMKGDLRHITKALGDLRIDDAHKLMKEPNVAPNLKCLEEMMAALRRRGVQVLIFHMPVSRYYYNGTRPDSIANQQAEYKRLCDNFGGRYRDYLRDPRFTDGDFKNCDHLNERGARKFSA